MSDPTCPSECAETNHPGMEHEQWLPSEQEAAVMRVLDAVRPHWDASASVSEPLSEDERGNVCATCGRDNRNGTHDALEGAGHLNHPFTSEKPDFAPETDSVLSIQRALHSWLRLHRPDRPGGTGLSAQAWADLADLVAAREAKARAEAGEQIAQAVKEHVEHMRGYTIPASGEQWLSGYDHALHLFARDAGFIADRATGGQS